VAVWKFIQVGIVAGIVYWNMLAGWTTNMYLPVLIGVMVAYVLSEIWLRPTDVVALTAR
jgi:hypothetical protein